MDLSAAFSLNRSQTLKPARRKLQKNFTRSKSKRASLDHKANRKSSDTMNQPFIPLPPDLSDSKWLHYIQDRGLMSSSPMRSGASKPQRAPLVDDMPEFSRLSIDNEAAQTFLDDPEVKSPMSSTSTDSMRRRHAKTPVYWIGQLDRPVSRRRNISSEKTCSVDLIADQYRALIESRGGDDAESVYSEAHSESSPFEQANHENNDYYSTSRPESLVPMSAVLGPPLLSPATFSATSDDGTLVGHDEDAIYFKPICFSPEPSPPLSHRSFEAEMTAATPLQNNLSLQICTDLLTRELSSAVADRPQRRSNNAALQIWVMIEAYESLRNQLAETHSEHMANIGPIFDTWLRSLYAIHSSISGNPVVRVDSYDDLEEDLD